MAESISSICGRNCEIVARFVGLVCLQTAVFHAVNNFKATLRSCKVRTSMVALLHQQTPKDARKKKGGYKRRMKKNKLF